MEDPQTSGSSSFSTTSCSSADPLSAVVNSELWLIAEHRAQEILCAIQPGAASEQKRKSIIDYLRWLLKHHFGTEVLPFGSVPLRTYLPDGDIDLTVLTDPLMEEYLVHNICRILKQEEENPEYPVRDIQYIQAQVKIIKCRVANFDVDFSFNQMAGLLAVKFLEQADQFLGKDQLLKRSIILIKAWCFYESHILGARHGMMATYALEILVLHIVNLFHSSLHGPLAVLYRFMDYYNKFDWERYCVKIDGSIPISHLTNNSGELTGPGNGLTLNQESQSSAEHRIPEFRVKHLNIVDPLKAGNNLGRSVNRGNFYHIKSTLAYGAQKLGKIVELPSEFIVAGVDNFFHNTLHQIEEKRRETQVPVSAMSTGRSEQRSAGDCDSLLSGFYQYGFPGHGRQSYMPLVRYPRDGLWQNILPVLPVFRSCAQGPALISLLPRPQGTGTFIPCMTSHESLPRARTLSSKCSRQCGRSNTDENPPQLERSGDNIHANLQALEKSKNVVNDSGSTSEIHGSRGQVKFPQVKVPATADGCGASGSMPLVTESAKAEMGEKRTQNPPEHNQERPLFHLTSNDDFPPLRP